MSRAMVTFERTSTGDWKPVTVFLATRARLQGRTLPGDPARQAKVDEILATAKPPAGEGNTLEDFIAYAVGDSERGWTGALCNGHTTWATEVAPMPSLQNLYEKHVLQIEPDPSPGLNPPSQPR